ncbi:MAG: hypothetical protein M3O30_19200 [Planctomycetota bacterium]|nr:hypothetical protein [Planctomycetota bacterium]
MAVILIGIDDTDNETSPGTGKLARRLAEELTSIGATTLGLTRHQFLVDDRIPYTSHNSGACVAVEWSGAINEMRIAMELIGEWAAEGSDPGVCIAASDTVPDAVCEWGWRATREVLTMDEAVSVARAGGLQLRALGGTGQGIIGALASVGLRADGNEGRFLDLPGLRELGEYVTAAEVTKLGIELDHRIPDGNQNQDPPRVRGDGNLAIYRTMGWVRPRLVQGKAVWPVEWSEEHHEWISVDQKRSRPLE